MLPGSAFGGPRSHTSWQCSAALSFRSDQHQRWLQQRVGSPCSSVLNESCIFIVIADYLSSTLLANVGFGKYPTDCSGFRLLFCVFRQSVCPSNSKQSGILNTMICPCLPVVSSLSPCFPSCPQGCLGDRLLSWQVSALNVFHLRLST